VNHIAFGRKTSPVHRFLHSSFSSGAEEDTMLTETILRWVTKYQLIVVIPYWSAILAAAQIKLAKELYRSSAANLKV
jgi:hypothetical protein